PYNSENELVKYDSASRWGRYVWLSRRCSEGMISFNRQTRRQLGESWWSWYRWIPERFKTRLSIVFAFVATHNHFVLDRGGNVFKQSAPVIKLSPEASEDDHLAILGLLNSSTGCFWMQQTMHNKGGPGGASSKDEKWHDFFEFSGTRLSDFPIPA